MRSAENLPTSFAGAGRGNALCEEKPELADGHLVLINVIGGQ